MHDLRKGSKVSIENWADFRDGKFEELWEYGKKITSDKEAKTIKSKQEKLKRKIDDLKLENLKAS